jgi:phenylacetate-CoA ligase/benzoylacetate-CoA ligase
MPEYWTPELETRPWPELERWQAEQATAMLAPLRRRSLLYARLHADVPDDLVLRSAADLAALPFTFKDDLRAAQEAATDERPFGDNQAASQTEIVQAISSSGTTGRPLYYALTARDVETIGDAVANVWFTAGIRKDDVVAHLVGLPMVAGGLPYADGFRRIGATLCWLGGFPTERILREMRHLRVTALLATTSFALHLSEQWDAVGRETHIASRLAKVIGGGEPGLGQPELRRRIVGGLALTHLRETMGLGDVIPSMWGECEVEDGMHFNARRHAMLELIDPESGQAVPWREGATGEIVYTALDREATPVVRYRSRDHAEVVAMGCACGRTGPRIRCIGRTDDMLIYKGMNVFPTAIRDLVVERFAGRIEPMLRLWKTRRDQVRFDQPIEVDVEASAPLDDAARGALALEIEDLVRSQLQVRIAVTVLERGGLPRGVYKNAIAAVRES